MPKKKEHLTHSLKRHPEIPKEIHEMVHPWMDDPANWNKKPYKSGYERKKCYSGHTHRDIRHEPEKVAKALSGGNKKKEEMIKKVATAHRELDGLSKPNILRRHITERDFFNKDGDKKYLPPQFENIISKIKTKLFKK